jgi:hypothetical protein
VVPKHGHWCVIPDILHKIGKTDSDGRIAVNILDTIMFEAQRQGSLSFYMVTPANTLEEPQFADNGL